MPLAGVTLSQPAPPPPTMALHEVVSGSVSDAAPTKVVAGTTEAAGDSPKTGAI